MSKKRKKPRARAATPQSPPAPWVKALRPVLLIEGALIAVALIALRILDPFEQGVDAWVATIAMIPWTTLPLLAAYAASRPARPKLNQAGWLLAGLIGGTAMLVFLARMLQGIGDSTEALGIIVLPVYHWLLIAAMLVIVYLVGLAKR